MSRERFIANREYDPVVEVELSDRLNFETSRGKVRDIFDAGKELFLVATDRVSAFDHQIGVIPHRGQILNELSGWWFERTRGIVPNQVIEVIDPNTTVARKYPTVPLEMVVRGYNTGVTGTSIWSRYNQGQREFGGVVLPDGMRKNDRLPRPVLDPTTKAHEGHDEARTMEEIIAQGIFSEEEYGKLERIALALFERGQEIALSRGLVLVDTKYEFGFDTETGEFVLIDEVHTPDSSRYWDLYTLQERIANGEEPDNYDKEFLRKWLDQTGYRGEGEVPEIPDEIIAEARRRYIEVYQRLTGRYFVPAMGDRSRQISKAIERWVVENGERLPQRQQKALIVMGSESDMDHSGKIKAVFDHFGIEAEMKIASAHKTPEEVVKFVKEHNNQNIEGAFILVAGRSNALGGFVDFQTRMPTISCPPYSERFSGVDIFSSLRMPSGSSGVVVMDPEAAARHVARIFALNNSELAKRLKEDQKEIRGKVLEANERLG